ncbi:MAG: segregation and condensation protein A, partial [Limnohabitans sp.]
PMAAVTRQYLSYVDEIRTRNLELAAEYLLMAAMLIEIKSRMLLPPRKVAEGEEAEDPRAELVRRLLEYEQMKMASMRLGELPQYGRDFLKAQVYIEQSLQPRFADVQLPELQAAWEDILRRARLVQHHRISREELSVREHMSIILRTLQGRRFVEFESLFEPGRGVPVLVVTFVALLELAKENLIEVTQAEAFAPIYVRLAYTPS